MKIILLPVNSILLSIRLARERLGHIEKKDIEKYPISNRIGKNRDIVMFPTNGVGFGHFTRLLAVAKKIQKTNPDLEIVFFTTMPTLHILSKFGFPPTMSQEGIATKIWIPMSGILLAKKC